MDSSMKAVSFNRIRPKTPVFCAKPSDGMTQTSDKTIYGCSLDCSENDACIGFNHKEPQQVCQQFVSPFTNLSLTLGCTYYEVRRVVYQYSPLRIDPNCSQYWLARLLSFERLLLSVDVSVCLCVGNFDAKISETKLFRDSCPIGALLYRKVPTARRLLASSMTSSDYDVILVPSQYSKSTHSENRSRIQYFSRIFKCTL